MERKCWRKRLCRCTRQASATESEERRMQCQHKQLKDRNKMQATKLIRFLGVYLIWIHIVHQPRTHIVLTFINCSFPFCSSVLVIVANCVTSILLSTPNAKIIAHQKYDFRLIRWNKSSRIQRYGNTYLTSSALVNTITMNIISRNVSVQCLRWHEQLHNSRFYYHAIINRLAEIMADRQKSEKLLARPEMERVHTMHNHFNIFFLHFIAMSVIVPCGAIHWSFAILWLQWTTFTFFSLSCIDCILPRLH